MKTFCVAFFTLFVKTYSRKIQRLPNGNETKKLRGVELKLKRSTDTHTAGHNSCFNNGGCRGSEATIGDNSCHGFNACRHSKGNIGHYSCDGEESCYYADGTIGDHSCIVLDSCRETVATIADNSCHGYSSCESTSGTIGDHSCTVNYACRNHVGSIGDNSCGGRNACQNHVGSIGDNSCTANYACQNHEGDIPSNCESVEAMEAGLCTPTVLPNQACRDEKKNLGLFETPEQCMDAAMSDSECTGGEIMWSGWSVSYHSWGCRCCSEHLTCPPATSDYYSNRHWDIYEYRNCQTFPENVEHNKQCISQSKNLGTGFSTPEECMAAAASDSGCTGQEIMWSDSYSSSWGCRCCSENPTCPPDYSSYPSNSNWDVYRYEECQ